MNRLSLRQLRESRLRSQVEVAEAMGVSQPAVSKLERRSDVSVGSLASYVAALGGRLELAVRFPDSTESLDQGPKAPSPANHVAAPPRRVAEPDRFVMPDDWAAEVLRIRSLPPDVRMEEVANLTEFFAEATRRG